MKFLRYYIFPPLYGLVVYFTIRLLTDSASGAKFWERSWQLNLVEIICSMGMGYVEIAIFNWFFKWIDSKWGVELSYKRIYKELRLLFLVNFVLQNITLIPFAALTDDGLQLVDFIEINTIPLLYIIIYYGITRSNKFLRAYIESKLQLESIKNEQLQTELKFLRAQYHPHFLFNALNTIYFQMDEDVKEAKKTVEKFSELLRYQLYDQQKKVTLDAEINYLKNFIDLQKIRISENLHLDFVIDQDLNGEQLYPLLLLPLVENAFKYAGGENIIVIELKRTVNGIDFLVKNTVPAAHLSKTEGNGIGLENLKRRLHLLYPNKYQLNIEMNNQFYTAQLKLTLKE